MCVIALLSTAEGAVLWTGQVIVQDATIPAGGVQVYNVVDGGYLSTFAKVRRTELVQASVQGVNVPCLRFPPATESLHGTFDVHGLYSCSTLQLPATPTIDMLAGRKTIQGPCGAAPKCVSNYALIHGGGTWAGSATITLTSGTTIDQATVVFPTQNYENILLDIWVETALFPSYTLDIRLMSSTGTLVSQKTIATVVEAQVPGMNIVTAEAISSPGPDGYAVFAHATIIPPAPFCLTPVPAPDDPDQTIQDTKSEATYPGYLRSLPTAFGIGSTCQSLSQVVVVG